LTARSPALQDIHTRKTCDMRDIKNFINGEYVTNASGKTFDKHTPIDGSVIGKVYEAGRPEVDAAVKAARAALKGPWGALAVNERVSLLDEVANEINRRFDDFLAAEVADTGKPHSLASHVDIPRAARPTSRSLPTPSRTHRPSPSRCARPTAAAR
jgi:acyl-CoA reductase-like NAD-dependent aldehyde dehydrogenase